MFAKKKICFIVATPITANAFLLKHFEYLSEEFDVYLVANFEDNPTINFSSPFVKEKKNINIHRNISLLKDFKALLKLKKYLATNKFDAVHTITPKAGLLGILAAKMAGIKVRIHIFTGQIWHTKKGLFKYLLKKIDKFIVFCTTDILVDGQSQRKFLIQNKIINDKNSRVLGKGSISGVDVNKFVPNQSIKEKYRAELNFKDEIVFLFLGRLNIDKGVLDLAEAFSILNKEFPQTRLIFVGPDEEEIQQKITNSDYTNSSIIFYGATTKPQDVMQMADVFCLPSYREGFGTSVIEASLIELPIICSDTYGLTETIVDNVTGLRHEVKNIDSIYQQMKKMINPDVRKELGKNGRQYVLDNFSAEMISKQWLDFYKNRLK
jgi:glycosyltransferase involved in cell wall biosynthesis